MRSKLYRKRILNMISYFDLHCDTLREAYIKNYSLNSSPLHISLDKTKKFEKYIQIMAIWSDCRFNDHDCYVLYQKILDYAKTQKINFIKKHSDLSKHSFILAIEDARIIENDLSRIDKFYEDGVRFLTLNWNGENILGGAWNTDVGLSNFGNKVILKCFEKGINIDISHSSRKTIENVFKLAESNNKKVVATHSNSYSVCKHNRNLTDEEFLFLVNLNSIVGISLCAPHLSNDVATINDIIKHIYHFLSLGGENTICLGCDFDGISVLPKDIFGISDIHKVYNEIYSLFGEKIAKKIFFENAYNFTKENLK